MDTNFLNGWGGQALLGAMALLLGLLGRYIGRRFDVTEEQARHFLDVLRDFRRAGKEVVETDLAQEVQHRVRGKKTS